MTDPDAETREFVSALFKRDDTNNGESTNDDEQTDEVLAFARRLFADIDDDEQRAQQEQEQHQAEQKQRHLRSLEGTGGGRRDPNAELRSFAAQLFGLEP